MRGCCLLAVACIVALAGGTTSSAQDPARDGVRVTCASLAGFQVPAVQVGLPSGPATVASATLVEAGADGGGRSVPAHCRVLGTIAPVDPAAQLIHFQVNLPESWNGKAVQYGGGGYNGTLITGLLPLRDAAPGDPLPLARGYATLGTDSGHQQASFPPDSIGAFGLNDEMLTNYGYAAYKKVHDVAVVLMRDAYGRAPERFYYFGGSEGGREGLTMAQRFPDDYDGVVSIVPVVQLSMLFQSYLPVQAPQFAGGWLSPTKVTTLARHVAAACDARDGLADGVISDALGCAGSLDLSGLRCPDDADSAPACLSDAQLATVAALGTGRTFPFPLANGLTRYPGWLLGNETTPDPASPTMTRWVTGTAAPTWPLDPATASQQWLYGTNFVRFFATRRPDLDPRTYRPEDHRERLVQVSEIIDSTNPDLGPFFRRGGKLIMRENLSDFAQSPLAGIDYFKAVTARVGQEAVRRSARLYVSPGSNHTGTAASVLTGEPVPTASDLLDPLDRWVTGGEAPPDALVQVQPSASAPPATRPMCQYPLYPHYEGGDARSAASYRCTASRM